MEENKAAADSNLRNWIQRLQGFAGNFIPYPGDLLITALVLAVVTAIGTLFYHVGFTESNIITVYLLGVLLTSLFTKGYACSVICSVMSVVLFNYFLTVPRSI